MNITMIYILLLIFKFYLICLPLVTKDITLKNLTNSFFNYRVLTKFLHYLIISHNCGCIFIGHCLRYTLSSADCLRGQGDETQQGASLSKPVQQLFYKDYIKPRYQVKWHKTVRFTELKNGRVNIPAFYSCLTLVKSSGTVIKTKQCS